MKTTTQGTPHLPTPPTFGSIEVSAVDGSTMLENVPEDKNSFLNLDFSHKNGFSFLSDTLKTLDMPPDMINFAEIFSKLFSATEEMTKDSNFLQTELTNFALAMQKLIRVIDAAPTNSFDQLISGLLVFIEFFKKGEETLPIQRNASSPTKSPRPITIIPKIAKFGKKNPRLIQPQIFTNKSTNQTKSITASLLPPLNIENEKNSTKTQNQNNFENDETILLLAKFLLSKAIYATSTNNKSLEKSEILINLISSEKDNSLTIPTKTCATAALCRMATDKTIKEQISKSSNFVEFLFSYLETEREQCNIHFLTQIVSLLRIISNEEIKTRVSTSFVRILRIFPTYHLIVLNICYFFASTCSDAAVRNSIISEFDSEVILTLFLQLLSIFKNSENITTRISFILSTLYEKEFDIQSVASEVSDPVSISVTLELLPDISTKKAAISLVILVASLARNKECIKMLKAQFSSLFRSTNILLDPEVSLNVINLTRLFVEQGENIKIPDLFARVEDWLSCEDERVNEAALSLLYELSQYVKLPTNAVKATIPFIGDSKHKLSFLALHVLAVSSGDKELVGYGQKIDLRVMKAIQEEELDEGTIKEIANLFQGPLRCVFSEQTLDDARAFDDLAIATV